MVKKFNISRPKKYFKDNVEKTLWQNIGTITEFHKDDGSVSRIIEIPAIGLEANIFPFEDKKGDKDYANYGKQPEAKQDVPTVEYPQEVINQEDIPY